MEWDHSTERLVRKPRKIDWTRSREWTAVRDALLDADIAGIEDFGLFVNNTKYFEPSGFDERSAAPVLLELLPNLTDPVLVEIIGRYLRRPWIRPQGFEVILAAFRQWGVRPEYEQAGWVLGHTLASAADNSHAMELLELAADKQYGWRRAMIVDSLWRFKGVAPVQLLLLELIADHDVCFHAMSSLRRTIGNEAAEPILAELAATASDAQVKSAADDQLKRIRKKLAKPSR